MKSILVILLSLITIQISAQAFRLSVGNSIREISLSEVPGDIEVRNATGKELKIELVLADPARKPPQAISVATDNTGKGLHYEQTANRITFRTALPGAVDGKYIIEIPAGIALIVEGPTIFTKSLDIMDYTGSLDIRSEHDVTITGLTTGLILHNPSGQVAVKTGTKKFITPYPLSPKAATWFFISRAKWASI